MKFYIKEVILWFKNETPPRKLIFHPNKINVITGGSNTGKTSILSIIDYCLLSTSSNIVEKIINENVEWYGLSFSINEKEFIIARRQPVRSIGSKEVYFSSIGELPETPQSNIDIKTIKSSLEQEFSIDENLKIPYGGRKILQGSKISYRYFLLFNTLSEDTIADTRTFFDFNLHDKEKYTEALDRIFFLAIGVDDATNILVKEKIATLEKELDKIEKKKKVVTKEERLFNEKILKLFVQAQEFDLVERRLLTPEDAYDRLKKLVYQFQVAKYSNNLKEIEELNKKKRSIWRKIRNLERFNDEYAEYKKNIKTDFESLRPIEFLQKTSSEMILSYEVTVFLESLEKSFLKIKKEIYNKKNISVNVKSEISKLKSELTEIENNLSNLPTNTKDFTNEIEKFIFIGELKSQIDFYQTKWNILEELPNPEEINEQLKDLNATLKDTIEKKKIVLQLLENCIQKYFDETSSMGVYENYKIYFDELNKVLKLRNPEELTPITNLGSKSNYMFLHLHLFLGLHEHMIKYNPKYVPQFLILDQPSQPYYEGNSYKENNNIEKDDDKIKLQDAFKLLNGFINNIMKEHNNTFQIILLEHAPQEYWNNPKLENFHLVEEFRNGNALIPINAISKL